MINKRKIFRNLDNFIFNSKNLNIVIAVLLSIFMVTFTIVCAKEDARLRSENEVYSNMLKSIEEYQLNVIYSNVSPNSGYVDSSKEYEKPIFSDAKEAVLTAFNNLYNYSSYEIVGNGISYAEAVGQNVEVKNTSLSIRYSDGREFERSCRVETKTSFGQTEASECVYQNKQKYKRMGSNVHVSNDECVATFGGSFSKVQTSVPYMTTYIINENTIQHKRSFSFVRDKNNKIMYYKATVTLDTEEAIKDYGQNIMEEGGTSYPVFSKIELACIVDRDGHLVSYTATETMTVSKRIVFNITTSITNITTRVVISHDSTPSMPCPSVWFT